MSEALVLGILAFVGVMLSPLLLALLNEYLASRRERRKEQKAAREAETAAAIRSSREAMDAKDLLISTLRAVLEAKDREINDLQGQVREIVADRDSWREVAESLNDGWYGQRPKRG